jgi:hypothetical protein
MNQYLNIDDDHNLQKIVIASAVMHILFIALVTVPLGTKEREEKSYFVNLVPQTEMKSTPKTTLLRKPKPLRMVKKQVKATPPKKHQNEKKTLNTVITEEKNSIKKNDKNQINLLPKPLRQTEDNKILSKREFEIKRDIQKPKEKYRQETVPIDKGYRGPIFAAKGDKQNKEYMIARKSMPAQTDNVPIDKGYREPTFAAKEDVQSKEYMIARKNRPVPTETASKSPKSRDYGNPGIHVKGNVEFDSLNQKGGSKTIEKPGLAGDSHERRMRNKEQEKQIITGAALKGEKEYSDKNTLSTSEISIQGVPLDDLIACTNALDERMLKKKILKIVGDKRGCYSPNTGKYIFLGTGRFTSFDMIILPASGRELSHRCEELKNAFFCLNSIKE